MSLLAGATLGYSQGVINWSDYQPANNSATPPLPAFLITIWSPGTETQGTGSAPNNTSGDLPAGTATYSGAPLSGAAFEVGLYVDTTAGAVQTDILSGTPTATAPFLTGSDAGGWDFSGGFNATVPTLASGTAVFAGLAAWSTSSGATSYAQALSQGVPTGFEVSTGTTALGGGGSPPATPGTLAGIGLQDFQLSSIPEPSTIALGVIGASTFLMRLRRKQ